MKGILTILSFFLFINAFAQYGTGIDSIQVPLNATGSLTEKALISLPDNYFTTTGSYPVIIMGHGAGGGAKPLSYFLTNSSDGGMFYWMHQGSWPTSFTNPADGKQYKFICIIPDYYGTNYSTPAAQMQYVINWAVANYRIDINRIYITGLSDGGLMTEDYADKYTATPLYRPAAIVPMSAATGNPNSFPQWADTIAADNIPVWAFGSVASDPFGGYEQTLVNQINAIHTGQARLTNYVGGHCCWGNYYNPSYREAFNGHTTNIYEWMLQFSRYSALLANAGLNQTITLPVDSVILSGTATGGTPAYTYSWQNVSGPNAPIASHTIQGGHSYVISPDAQNHVLLDNTSGTYHDGDTLYLSGWMKAFAFNNASFSTNNKLVITSLPGNIIGDSTWNGGAYAQGIVFTNVHGVELYNLYVVGSQSHVLSFGAETRTAYIDVAFGGLSYDISFHNNKVSWGGAGVFGKTEVDPANARTWFSSGIYLRRWEIYNNEIHDTYNEAMYIGHTAAYWNIQSNTPYYPSDTLDMTAQNDTLHYKRALKLTNVLIHDNYIHDIGNDAIQCAAIDTLEVYRNRITNWCTKHGPNDQSGIMAGGRVTHFNFHDNYLYNSWGEFFEVYADSSDLSIIQNNLLNNDPGGDMVSMRGAKGLTVQFIGNTVANAAGHSLRVNGFFGQRGVIAQKNIFLASQQSAIYVENHGTVTEGSAPNNDYTLTTCPATIDSTNYFLGSSTYLGFGYIYNANAGSYTLTSLANTQTVKLHGLIQGTYDFRLTVKDTSGNTSQDDMNVYVSSLSPGVGDGVTDDYAAMQAFFNAHQSAGDTLIVFPANKKYLLSNRINITNYAKLHIVGNNSSIVKKAGYASDALWNIKGSSTSLTINGVRFYGLCAYANGTLYSGDDGLSVYDSYNIDMHNCIFHNFGDGAFKFATVTNIGSPVADSVNSGFIHVYNDSVFNSTQTSTTYSGGVHDYVFENNYYDTVGISVKFASRALGSQRLTIQGNTLKHVHGNGFETVNYGHMTIQNNSVTADPTATGCGWNQYPLAIISPTVPTWEQDLYKLVFQNNTINGFVRGIRIDNGSYADDSIYHRVDTVSILNNTFLNTKGTSTFDAGVTLSGYNIYHVTINGNYFGGLANNLFNTAMSDGTLEHSITVSNNTYAGMTGAMVGQNNTHVTFSNNNPAATPTVFAGANQTITAPVSLVTLTGTATPASGHSITSTNWSVVSGPSSYAFSQPTSLSTLFYNLTQGVYVVKLTATQDDSQSSSSMVTITVIGHGNYILKCQLKKVAFK